MKLVQRAIYIYRSEGISMLAGRCLSFLSGLIYQNRRFYIIRHLPSDYHKKDFVPELPPGFTFRLIKNGDIPGSDLKTMYLYQEVADARERLESGAAAFCVFSGNRLASIGWAALTSQAHLSLFQPPYKVDFDAGEASTGGGWSDPAFRIKGLGTYIYCKRLEYIWSQGRKAVKTAVLTGNLASLKMHAKLSPSIIAEGHDFKLLWYRKWTEKPICLDISKIIK